MSLIYNIIQSVTNFGVTLVPTCFLGEIGEPEL